MKTMIMMMKLILFFFLSLALPSFSHFLFCSAMSGKIPQEEVTESGPCVQVDNIQIESHVSFNLYSLDILIPPN